MRVDLDSWALKLSRVSASTTLPGSWFQRRMACGKNDVIYTVVLCVVPGIVVNGLWFEERCGWGGVPLVYQQGCTLCGTSSLSGHMLVCFVVSATGVAVAWLWHCLCTGSLQWQTWRLDVVLPQPCWCCLFCWGSIFSHLSTFKWKSDKLWLYNNIPVMVL